MNPGDTLTGTAGLVDALSVSLLNAGGAVGTATAAVAQVNTYAIPVPADATNTVTVNYGGIATTVITGATSTTHGTAITAAINQSAGRTIAVFTAGANPAANPGSILVTAPVAGTALPAITFAASVAANQPTVTFTTPNTAATGSISFGNTTGVEVLNITNGSGQAATIDVNGSLPSATTLNTNASTGSTTYTNVGIGVATIGINNVATNDADVTATYRTGLTSLTNALTLNVSNVASATNPVVAGNSPVLDINGGAAGQGWDIVNVNATGGASRLTALQIQDGGNATTLSTLNISGSASFRVENALEFLNGLGTINASTNTGGVNLQVAATETVAFTGGSGNDRINFAGTGFTITDTVNGGAGVNTLALGNVGIATTDTDLVAAINATTNIQTIEFTSNANATYAMNAVSQTAYAFSGAGGTLTVNQIANDSITISAARGANAVDLNAAVGTTALSLTLSNVNGNASGTTSTTDTAGFNTVSIVSNSATSFANAMSGNFTTNANAVVTITGNAGLTLGTMQAAVVIDGSGAGGILTLTGSGVADSITGGSFADVLVGGDGNDVIVAGAGADAITGGLAADTITTGAGIDTLTVNAATASGDSLLTGVTGALTAANLATFTRAWDIVTGEAGDVIFLDSANVDLAGTIVNGGTTALSMGGALAVGSAYYWNDGTNTYLVVDTSGATAADTVTVADTLIVLTGVRTIGAAAIAATTDANYTILS